MLDRHSVGRSLKFEAHGLGSAQQVTPEQLLLSAVCCERQARTDHHRTLRVLAALPDLFGDGCERQQEVVVIFGPIPQNRLAAVPQT